MFLKNSYRANDDSQSCPPNSSYEQCGGRVWNGLVDAMTIKTIEGATDAVSGCTLGVGKRPGTDCPSLLYALLGRKPGATERYWPSN